MRNIIFLLFFIAAVGFTASGIAAPPETKSKFYDFGEQVIDGQIKKPTALYTDSKEAVKFGKLLKLKKSFLPAVLESAKDPVFK